MLRKEKKLLLREVAEMLEIDVPMLSKIELGDRYAKKLQVYQLVHILQNSWEELFPLWLADQVLDIIENESFALKAISLAEEEVKFQTKNML